MVRLTCDENALRVAYTGEFHGIRAMETHMRNLISWSVTSTPIPWNQDQIWGATLQWPSGRRTRSVQAFLMVNRLDHVLSSVDETLAKGDEAAAFELEFLARAHVVVFLLDARPHVFQSNRMVFDRFRADVLALGRKPEDFPVLFQVDRLARDDQDPIPLAKFVEIVSWPRCDYQEAYPAENRGFKEAMDRAIGLYDEMQAMGNEPTR